MTTGRTAARGIDQPSKSREGAGSAGEGPARDLSEGVRAEPFSRAAWIRRLSGLAGVPVWVLVLIAAAGILVLTEMTSNTATAATFLPVASGVALGTGIDPLMLAAPVALAASCAFMLPVGTPPNAIAYGSGYVTIGQMVRGGVLLNVAGVVVITMMSMTLLVWVFGLSW